MFCCECSYAISSGTPYVILVLMDFRDPEAKKQESCCLDCAIKMDWIHDGQTIHIDEEK